MTSVLASTAADWRAWLARHGRSEKEAWLVIHHRDSGTPSIGYQEAIEHALRYGWIDSQARKHDADSMLLRFTPRGPRSRWSWVNRERAARLIELGLMTEIGRGGRRAVHGPVHTRRPRRLHGYCPPRPGSDPKAGLNFLSLRPGVVRPPLLSLAPPCPSFAVHACAPGVGSPRRGRLTEPFERGVRLNGLLTFIPGVIV